MRESIGATKIDQAVVDAYRNYLAIDDADLHALRARVIADWSASKDRGHASGHDRSRTRSFWPNLRVSLAIATVTLCVIASVAVANPGDIRSSVLESIGLVNDNGPAASTDEVTAAEQAFDRTKIGQRPDGSSALPSVRYEGDLTPESGRKALSFSEDGVALDLYLARTEAGKVCFAGIRSGTSTGGVSGCIDQFLDSKPFTVVNQSAIGDRTLLTLITSDAVTKVKVTSTTGVHDAVKGTNAFAWLATNENDVPSVVEAELSDGTVISSSLNDIATAANEVQLIRECNAARGNSSTNIISCTSDVRQGRYP
jgi:hypothetical protein